MNNKYMINESVLKNVDIFSNLKANEISKLAKIIKLKKVKKGDCLFKKGDKRTDFFVVLSGHIKLSQSNNKNEEGWAILKAQDFICANALINPGSLHMQTSFAVEDSELLSMSGSSYARIVKNNEHINNVVLSGLIAGLNDRLKHSTNKLVALYKTGQITANEEGLKDIARETLKVLTNIIKIKKAVFTVIDKYKNENIILAAEGYKKSEDIANKVIKMSDDKVISEACSTRKLFRSYGEGEFHLFLASIYKMEKALGVPLIFNNKVIGMILLGDKKNGEFSVNNEVLLQLIANQIVGAVYRAEEEKDVKAVEELKRIYVST